MAYFPDNSKESASKRFAHEIHSNKPSSPPSKPPATPASAKSSPQNKSKSSSPSSANPENNNL